jgi:hypothetical protein
VCTGATVDPHEPSWLTGSNAIGTTTWQKRCHVVAAERGRRFAFVNHGWTVPRHELVRWVSRSSGDRGDQGHRAVGGPAGYEQGERVPLKRRDRSFAIERRNPSRATGIAVL